MQFWFNGLQPVFDSLLDVISSSPWTYGVVFLFAFLDVVFPIVPSETSVITAAVLAATGDLQHRPPDPRRGRRRDSRGQHSPTALGRMFESLVRRRFFGGERARHLDRAERAIDERGGYLIVIGRFIPGGRTAITFACGMLQYPWARFILFDVAAGLLWASYAGFVGYFGGKAFEESPLKGILLALGIAFAVAGTIEGYRWIRRRSGRRGAAAADGVDHR